MRGDIIDNAIDRAMARPRVLGRDDCGTWVADIVKKITGHDPARELRRRYCDERGRDALIVQRWGTWVAMLDAVLEPAGYVRLKGMTDGARGDIGFASRGDMRGAICLALGGGEWVTRGEKGVAFVKSNVIYPIWRNRHGH